jgi:predicted ATPase/DNA-binding winged helix-turn-helix (wHTH) protein
MPAGSLQRYRFGLFELQPDERRLLKAGVVVPLRPHAFELLLAMVERAEHLVPKDELFRLVWGKVVVEDNTLQAHISALRKVLGRDAVTTVSRSGYRFGLEVTRVERAAAATPHNLPRSFTSFVGRDGEIEELKRLIDTSRLLTLTGAGGSGKTRLAVELAAQVVDRFPEGVWLVELASLADPALVTETVANTLGAQKQGRLNATDAAAEHVASRRMLLVLDNAEHVRDPCARLADALIERCAQLVILATSREHLGISRETTYRVPSLSVPDPRQDHSPEALAACDSARLFIDRARLQRPHFAVTGENAPALASICRRLDGIPLAIELAAPRIRSMSLEEVNRRLDQRFGLLTGGSHDALPRQRTLRALVDWSYDLLGDTEKAVLRRASVFAGGWNLNAAETVCVADDLATPEVLDILTSLVDKSLIVRDEDDGVTRFKMLETIRHYARDQLVESGERDDARRRHFQCYSEVTNDALQKIRGGDAQGGLGQLDIEHDNLRAMLTWCSTSGSDVQAGLNLVGTLGWFWSVRGYLREGREWIQRMLDASLGGPPTSISARAMVGAGVLIAQLGDDDGARRSYEGALAIYRTLGDRQGEGYALRSLGNVAFAQGDYATARSLCEQSLTIARELGDKHAVASLLGALGEAAGGQGDVASARDLLHECLRTARADNDRWTAGWTLGRLATVEHRAGNDDLANDSFKEALTILHDLQDQWGIASALEGWAAVLRVSRGPLAVARLWGGVERLRNDINAQLPPADRARHDAEVAHARAALADDEAFDHAWEDGRQMNAGDLVRYALELGSGEVARY